jgi:hypothetical protein
MGSRQPLLSPRTLRQTKSVALIKRPGLRTPTEDENIFYTRLDTGIREGCQVLRPTDRVRYLGWFTAMSDDVDESHKQTAEEVNGGLRRLLQKKFVEIAKVPRF